MQLHKLPYKIIGTALAKLGRVSALFTFTFTFCLPKQACVLHLNKTTSAGTGCWHTWTTPASKIRGPCSQSQILGDAPESEPF